MKKVLFQVIVIIMTICFFNCVFAVNEEVEVIMNKQIKVTFNGEYQQFQNVNGVRVFPLSYEGTTYLPIRSISSLFNSKIKWDGITNSVLLGEGELDAISSKRVEYPISVSND